jgi:hypothetical protein
MSLRPATSQKRRAPPIISRNVCDRTEAGRLSSDNPSHDSAALARFAIQRQQNLLKEILMSLGMILLIVLVLVLLGAIPTWPHSRSWGYGPSGGLGLVVVVLVVLLVVGII